MKRSGQIQLGLLVGIAGILPYAAPAAAQSTLSPAIVTKAQAFKNIDDSYRQALCGGSQSDRDKTKGVRDYVQNDLQQQIAADVTSSPLVQKALDAAAAAGETAEKVAATPGATDQDKSGAAAHFLQAKGEMKDVATREKAWIESELAKNYGVNFAAPEPCAAKPTVAAHEPEPPAKPHTHAKALKAEAQQQQPRASNQKASAAQAPTQSAPMPTFNIGIGGGGGSTGSISFGGSSISFGH